jgi:arabinofuranosyltransferase
VSHLRSIALLLLPAIVAVLLAGTMVVAARSENDGVDGFPLDDTWIHLTYARNLAHGFGFSYFPGQPASAGSTSPLFTLVLAGGFLATDDEKALGRLLSLAFQAGFLVAAVAWARRRLESTALAAAFALVIALDARLVILSVSGMETSLFLLLTALAFWARAAGRAGLAGLAVGLGVWTRPDAFILAVVFAIATLLERWPPAPVRRMTTGFALPAVLYFAFNVANAGALLPNTFGAKRAYYGQAAGSVHWAFLATHVREAFLGAGWLVLTPLALLAIGLVGRRLLRREPAGPLVETGWAVALPLAYFVLLPFGHRFARYLLPALPALALVALLELRRRWPRAAWAAVASALVLQAAALPAAFTSYRELVLYHHQRHERCGLWLREHTPAGAVVAANDVGAIAYYSGRLIVDVAGLVDPEVIPHLRQPDYTEFLADLFARRHVTHLALLTNWIEVANQAPLWVADPRPEVLQVHEWAPGRTLLVPEEATRLLRQARAQLRQKQVPEALPLLRRAIAVCPGNSRAHFLLGAALEFAGDPAGAERAYLESLRLFPGDREAQEGLAAVRGSAAPSP